MDVVSTSSLALDRALGVGGIPRGRVVEIYGPESGGKTTLALHIIAEAQKLGGKAAFIDAEHALDPVYARKLNVDVDHLLVSQPDNGEQALEITESLIKSSKIAIIVVDSVAALVPKAELEGDMGDPQMGLQARLMSQALRKLTGMTNQTKTILIFINQIREKIGVMFGSPETTTGGRALKFFSSVRLDIRNSTGLKTAKKISARRPASRLSRTKSRRPTPKPKCVSIMVMASLANGTCSSSGKKKAWWLVAGLGSRTKAKKSVKVPTKRASFC